MAKLAFFTSQGLVMVAGLSLAGSAIAAQQPGPEDVYVRVVDVGPGLCAVTEVPNKHYLVYDAGYWRGNNCLEAIREIVDGETIDLMIIGSVQPDHLGEADDILREYEVPWIIRADHPRWNSATWRRANEAIGEQVKFGASVVNLQSMGLPPRSEFALGDAKVTLIGGWGALSQPSAEDGHGERAEGVVVRLQYGEGSVMFTGQGSDATGSEPDSACRDAVKRVQIAKIELASDVLIAPLRSDNAASTTCFIEAVDPTFVIFSAGHDGELPEAEAVERYRDHGVPLMKIFRTDRADDEGGAEWSEGRMVGCVDGPGDDDVDILLPKDGRPQVRYRQALTGC
jgi:beta-lactamase superfamily II metal-dependent hydrolase